VTTTESPLSDWQNFYIVIATASATLIGAMFVVVSIGIRFLTPERAEGIRTFLTSTVLHLSTALLTAALTLVPRLDWPWLGAIIGIGGLGGLFYSGRAAVGFRQHQGADRSDFFWYVLVPIVAYAALTAAGAAALRRLPLGIDLLAAAVGLLLVAGIRNAWDMIVFFVVKTNGQG
jgi:hypothetical protein